MIIPFTLYLFILLELFFVSVGDLRERKIPNLWSLFNVGLFIIFLFFFPNYYNFNFQTFIFPIVFILVGFCLFVFRIMGGGDAKFIASLFLIIPLRFHDSIFRYLLLTTILIGLTFFFRSVWVHRVKLIESIKNKNIIGIKECFGSKFAYTPVVLISWVYLGWDLRKSFY